jgi:hypothetical protein
VRNVLSATAFILQNSLSKIFLQKAQFEETKAHSFLELKTIETRGEAAAALIYYRNEKNALSVLRDNLMNQKEMELLY